MTSRRKTKLYNYGRLLRSIHKGLNDVKQGRLFMWVDEFNAFGPAHDSGLPARVKNTRALRRRTRG